MTDFRRWRQGPNLTRACIAMLRAIEDHRPAEAARRARKAGHLASQMLWWKARRAKQREANT